MNPDLIVLDDEVMEVLADLQIQAMMFDMDIDLETASLVEKRKDNQPMWLKAWKDKENGGDRQPEDYEG